MARVGELRPKYTKRPWKRGLVHFQTPSRAVRSARRAHNNRGVVQLEEQNAHNVKAAGSSPAPATKHGDLESHRAYSRWHYQQNKAAYKSVAKAHNKKVKAAVREFVLEYLLQHKCLDCGERDPVVLEFDHREDSYKRFNIGNAARLNYSLNSVKKEVDKCDVRCANCHRRITYKRAGRTHRG